MGGRKVRKGAGFLMRLERSHSLSTKTHSQFISIAGMFDSASIEIEPGEVLIGQAIWQNLGDMINWNFSATKAGKKHTNSPFTMEPPESRRRKGLKHDSRFQRKSRAGSRHALQQRAATASVDGPVSEAKEKTSRKISSINRAECILTENNRWWVG